MKKGYKFTAFFLSLVLVFTSINLLTKAADDEPVPPRIVSFAVLPENVLEQTVYVGDDISKVVLPTTLTATVQTIKKEEEAEKEPETSPAVIPAPVENEPSQPEVPVVPESTPVPQQPDPALEPASEPAAEPEQPAAPAEPAVEPASDPAPEPDPEPAPEVTPAPESDESSEGDVNGEAGDSSASLMKSLFPATTVYAAEDAEDPLMNTEQLSVSVIWKIDPLKSSGIKFSSEIAGNKYIYVPEVKGDYEVKAILPSILVKVEEKPEKENEVKPKEEAEVKPEVKPEDKAKEKTEEKAEEKKDEKQADKDKEKDKDKDKDKEAASPAFEKVETVAGYSISIDAPEGVFPEGTTAKIQAISESESLIEGQVDGDRTIENVMAFDISFWHDGKEIEPENGKVNVSIELASDMKETLKEEDAQIQVFHVDDNSNVEEVACTTDGEEVVFSAESFSRYVLVTSSGATKRKLATPAPSWDTSQALTLTWTAIENAGNYLLQISVGGYSDTLTTSATTVNLVQVVNNLENVHQTSFNGQDVSVTVTAKVDPSASGKSYLYYDSDPSGAVSKTYTSSGTKTKLATPANVAWADGQTLTLCWDPVANAAQYEVSIIVGSHTWTGTATSTTTQLDLVQTINTYENQYQEDYNGQTIKAKVKAQVDSSGTGTSLLYYDSDYSAQVAKTYVRANPKTKLPAPANVRWIQGQTLTVAWDPVAYAAQYVVQVQVGSNTWAEKVNTTATTMDLVAVINRCENTYQADYSGQVIKASIQAQVDRNLTPASLSYFDSDFSQVVTKEYSKPAAVVTDSRLGIATTDDLLRVLEASLTAAQKTAATGKELEFDFSYTSGSVPSDAAAAFSNFAKANGYLVGETFDLSLTVKADDASIGNITTTNSEIPIGVSIPSSIQKDNRVFLILLYHGGVLAAPGSGTGSAVLIRTKQFSPYAILYYDPPEKKKHSDDNNNNNDSSDSSSTFYYDAIWRPSTPDELKRAAVVGREQHLPYYDGTSGYGVTIKNVMQGPKCWVSFEAAQNGYTIARTYDFWPNGQKVRSAPKEITITLKIPDSLVRADRDFRMICVTTGGQPIVLKDLDTNPNTITIKTDKFYAFALVFRDPVKPDPATTQTTKTTKKKKK
ncbi:hypothetical protein [Butyrivibrio sp. AE2032]|uniref:hypothetical protein n=1 Tax=Butyrivibrio sp. AE2032 TaxID=1458463 RepID=UPI00068F658F|nr:hypothetical protein [Butyrivibrio sp. AE2032]